MKRYQRFLPFALGLAAVAGMLVWQTGCKKDDTSGPGGGGGGGGAATIAGSVRDAGTTGNPAIPGATVSTSSTNSVTTDANGNFSLPITAGSNVTVSVTKNGFSLNQVVVNVASGATKQVTVNLLAVGATTSMSVSSGGNVTDPNTNAKITFPANFVSASGNVTVSITGLDPTTDGVKALPGGLDAIDASGNPVYLQPVSFAEYTVKDASGNVLGYNTSAGSGANIELPIPASLRGKPGYKNGDPIECYLYDPTDGKWKTPVPGVVGPSSVDGNPAIKATIFHLSWYGGAPATNQRACITGSVKNADGSAAVGVAVEGFAGGSSTTDAAGHYRIDAAPNSTVRVVATQLQGTSVRVGEVTVYTGSPSDTCVAAPDITLGAAQPGIFDLTAYMVREVVPGSKAHIAIAEVYLTAPGGGARTAWDSATVKLSDGVDTWTLTPGGSGSYSIIAGLPGSGNFALVGGRDYQITFDFDRNGTVDANGTLKMTGSVSVTAPAESATVSNPFTASWYDSASGTANYSPFYYLTVYGDSANRFFITQATSKVIGDGTVDSSLYGYPQPNGPLPAGNYNMNVWSFIGPAGFLQTGLPQTNINGQGASGYFYAFSTGVERAFASTGTAMAGRTRKLAPPPAIAKFMKTLPRSVRKQLSIEGL